MILPIALLVVFLGTVSAACDNQCSGHGACQIDDVCKCYDNWGVGLSHDSGDCSDRVCPFEIAWVDTPSTTDSAVGRFHRYAECAGRGICNRQTGECQCFDGYEGKACKRTTCPNDCSGHGTCEYIDDLYFADTWNEYLGEDAVRFQDDPKTFEYNGWDTRKTRGCICDATYGDIDCSKRMCPYGTDVLAVRDDLLVTAKYHKQTITFTFADSAPTTDTATFALTFRSRLNETFTTIPIKYDTAEATDLEVDVRLALLSLPNRVIDGVTVDVDNTDHTIIVTFTGDAVQGPQHLLSVQAYECAEGCTPRLTGLVVDTLVGGTAPTILETQESDYNSYECGRRGKCDYSTGLCQCFTGYTGDNCNTLTTLV